MAFCGSVNLLPDIPIREAVILVASIIVEQNRHIMNTKQLCVSPP
jgi:hypothetical protein